MKARYALRIAQVMIGAAVASALVVGSGVSAERGGAFKAAPQKPIEEHVLTVLEDRDTPDSRGDFKVVDSTPSRDVPGGFKTTSAPQANGVGAADDFKAGPGCSVQCITSGVAYARGPNAKLVVKTDTEARIWIHVEGPNGYYRVEDSGATEVTQFGFTFDDLQAGTTYQAWAVAKDKQNYESTRYGSFTTLVRNVKLSFNEAHITDHVYSPQKIKMGVWMDGEWDDDHTAHNLTVEDSKVLLGIHFIEYKDVDRYLDFSIQLYEGHTACNNLGHIDQPYHGPGSCSFLSFASVLEGENDLDARPADATSWTEWSFSRTMERPNGLWLPYDEELRFSVPVGITVTYVPWDY